MESIFIKKRLAAFAVLLGLGAGGVPILAQQTDSAPTAAVAAQTVEPKSIHKRWRKPQEYITAAEAAIMTALNCVHSIEDKMLEYPSNAQGVMQNLYQTKWVGKLVTTKIPRNYSLLTKSVDGNLKGTTIAAIVSDELTDAAIQMVALYPFMKQLVTSGSYNVTGFDGKNRKYKANLLNPSGRYYITNEMVTRLEAINTDLFILAWQARTLSWNDLWFSLDPEDWASVISSRNIISGIVAEWNRGYLLKW